MKKTIKTALFALMLASAGCSSKPQIASIEGGNIAVTAQKNTNGAEEIRALLKAGAHAVDSIKAPIIGTAAKTLTVYSPESPLMNFAADALRIMAQKESGEKIDLAVTNKGGLRSELQEGQITFGDIYSVFPFENTLALLTLSGEQLMQLFTEIATEEGEAISGARLTITKEGRLLTAQTDGRPVEAGKKYRIATSDYLAQGNDGLKTLAHGTERKIMPVTIRALMIEYINRLHKQGKSIDADTDGRITIID